ncbi:MAG: ABC transporter ATP-binding protein [Acidobacteria bacterium]|nr:ABC transporter ATP-binding protein [Acidobacteriota bacterium]
MTAAPDLAKQAPRLELVSGGVERRGRWLLRNVDLVIEPAMLTSVVGPNGAGKSTLLKLLSGTWRLTEGRALLGGFDLAGLPRRQAARRVAYVPQSVRPSFEFTVREFVTLGRYPHENRLFGTRSADRDWIDRCLDDTDVLGLSERRVTTLSGGELQRVLMARCLATEAEVLLLDEPTSNLDLAHGLDLLGLARGLVDVGRSVVLVLHDLNAAARFADRVAVLDGGALVAEGPPAEVLEPDLVRRVFQVEAVPLSGAASTVFDFEPLA